MSKKTVVRSTPVRTRSTLAGNGEAHTTQSVFCLERDLTVQPEECGRCTRRLSVHVDARGNRHFLCAVDEIAGFEEPEDRAGHEAWLPPQIRDVMEADVVCVRPDVSLDAAMALMLDRHVSGMPVVDHTGRAIGMVSKTDVVRHCYERGDTDIAESASVTKLGQGMHITVPGATTVADVMTPVAFVLSEHASCAQAAALMAYEGIHRLPVVSEQGDVVGLVAPLDILRWVAEAAGYRVPRRQP